MIMMMMMMMMIKVWVRVRVRVRVRHVRVVRMTLPRFLPPPRDSWRHPQRVLWAARSLTPA